MQYKGNNLIFFDIETGGFSAIKDPFILAIITLGIAEEYEEFYSIEEVSDYVKTYGINGILVTYNGENYYGGFDFPFLRTKYAMARTEWPFAGIQHLDLCPLVKKFFNTKDYEISIPSPNSSKINKTVLTKLAFANGLEYKTINETYEELMELHSQGKCDWLDVATIKTTEDNSLQSVYQKLFDPDIQEEYIDGEEVPELYRKGEIDKILFHCKNDVRRLRDVTSLILDFFPAHEIEKNINRL